MRNKIISKVTKVTNNVKTSDQHDAKDHQGMSNVSDKIVNGNGNKLFLCFHFPLNVLKKDIQN